MSEKDDFVEDLFRNLPKAPPLSELDLKRHEKMIRAHIAELKIEQAEKESSFFGRFQTQFQLAAGFLVVVGGISFAVSQGIFAPNSEVVVSMPTVKPTSPIVEPSQNSSSSQKPGSSSSTNNGSSEQFQVDDNTSGVDGNKYINNTGMNYPGELDQIKTTVKLSSKPIALSTISQSYGKCAIELGINMQLLGIDKGLYEGENILAFFYGESKTNFNIWIISKPCTKIDKI
jgi:hypothetical protein